MPFYRVANLLEIVPTVSVNAPQNQNFVLYRHKRMWHKLSTLPMGLRSSETRLFQRILWPIL